MASDFPILLPHPEIIFPKLNTSMILVMGGIWGNAKAGQTWLASDGSRFLLSADSFSVVYILKGNVYVQSSSGFINEIRTSPAVIAGQSAKPWIQVAETEIKLILGVFAGASGIGFSIVIGNEVLEFVVENRENFGKWQRQVTAVCAARAILKKHAPVLYDKVFNAVLSKIYKDVKSSLPDAVTPQILAFGIGVVVGTVGKKLASGKFSMLALIFVVLEQLAIRFSIGVIPGAIKITEEDYRRMASQIISQLSNAGVNLTDLDIRKIIDESRNHPVEIRKAFDEMKKVF